MYTRAHTHTHTQREREKKLSKLNPKQLGGSKQES